MEPIDASHLSNMADDEGTSPDVPAEKKLQRRVLGLAWPVISENLLQTMLGIVDTILVARLGASAIAGVGTALQIIYILIAALSALSVGASVLVAQAYGARDLSRANSIARQTLIWSALVSIPLAVVGIPLIPSIVGLFGLAPDVSQISQDYLNVTIGTIVALTTSIISGGVLRGIGDSRTPMLVTALSNVINVGLAYVMIYGHLGFPAMGAVGSAWATFLARLIGAVLLVMVLWRGRNGVRISGTGLWWPQFKVLNDILRIGLPAAFEQLLMITSFAVLTPIVAGLGTTALAAHRVIINATSISFLPGVGFGLATTALVGQAIGARRFDEAPLIAKIALRWAIIWMGVLLVVFLVFAEYVMLAFTDDPEMLKVGVDALRVIALVMPLWGMHYVYAGALRGIGNTRLPLMISGVGNWLFVGLGYLAMQLIAPSLASLWAVLWLIAPIQAVLFWWSWRHWQTDQAAQPAQESASVLP